MDREQSIVKWVSEQWSPQALAEHLADPKKLAATFRRRYREDSQNEMGIAPDTQEAADGATLYAQMCDRAHLNYKQLSREDRIKLLSIAEETGAESGDLDILMS